MPSPYAHTDDTELVEGCIAGYEDAWRALEQRYGLLVEAVIVRVLDQRRSGGLEDGVAAIVDSVMRHLRGRRRGPLRAWNAGECELWCYLAVIARQLAESHVQDATPVVSSLPTPAAVFLDDLVGLEPAKRITDALERLSPHITAMARLRLLGLERESIAAALGMPRPAVQTNLDRFATKVAELEQQEVDAEPAWRILLDCADMEERTRLALRTEDDPQLQSVRSVAEGTWRAVRQRALDRPSPRTGQCLDETSVAGLVDGSVRGPQRARAEGHLTTCARCLDSVATLTIDMRGFPPLREAARFDRDVALAAACVTTSSFRAADMAARRAAERGAARAPEMVRLAHLGLRLTTQRGDEATHEPSRVVSATVPSDEEAPLVALEALVAGDPHEAARAIDDYVAKSPLGARLRLLAQASGADGDAARQAAEAIDERRRADAGLRSDVEAVRALPDDRPLPREILVERLRDILPEAVRFVVH